MREAFRTAQIRIRINKIEGLRDAIEKEKIAHKECLRRRKSAAKCRNHLRDIEWAKKEIEELRDQVLVLHSKRGD